jgi:hypothetical protein
VQSTGREAPLSAHDAGGHAPSSASCGNWRRLFSDITKAVSWGPSVLIREEEDGRGQRVKVIVNTVSLVPSGRLDEDTAAAISAVSQSSTGTLNIKMHDKLAAMVALGKHLGMFVQRTPCVCPFAAF